MKQQSTALSVLLNIRRSSTGPANRIQQDSNKKQSITVIGTEKKKDLLVTY